MRTAKILKSNKYAPNNHTEKITKLSGDNTKILMFNFVINKTLQVFTFRFAPDSARNESSGRSRIRCASSKHFLFLSRY